MLDYRLHYAVMAAEDRLHPSRPDAIRPKGLARRLFRVGSGRPAPRSRR